MNSIINTHYVQLLLEDTDRLFNKLVKGDITEKHYRFHERNNIEKALKELRKK